MANRNRNKGNPPTNAPRKGKSTDVRGERQDKSGKNRGNNEPKAKRK